jgi:hypothetical protein
MGFCFSARGGMKLEINVAPVKESQPRSQAAPDPPLNSTKKQISKFLLS